MEAKDTVKQIALDVFGTSDNIRSRFPRTGEKIQEAMELSFKAGRREAVEWLRNSGFLFPGHTNSDVERLQAKLKEWL